MDEGDNRIWARRNSSRPAIRRHAYRMRREPTDAERKLWQQLRHIFSDAHFRRQVVIGGSIADFASHSAKLIIEVDGGQHSAELDARRSKKIERHGYRVLRFWNNDVLQNMSGVCESIRAAVEASTPTPDPSPQGGGE